jgi:hypothetical protein
VHGANDVLEEERMPWKEGWRPINRIDGFSIAQTVLQIALRTPEKVSDGEASTDSFCLGGFCAPSPGGFVKAFQA